MACSRVMFLAYFSIKLYICVGANNEIVCEFISAQYHISNVDVPLLNAMQANKKELDDLTYWLTGFTLSVLLVPSGGLWIRGHIPSLHVSAVGHDFIVE